MVELLAPAGNFISLTSALKNGADAIYIGLEDMNMRVNASNFSLEDIKKASEMTREYGAKLYVCTNTIMKDSDIEILKEQLPLIKEYGADGFRCDVGDDVPLDFWAESFLRLKRDFPELITINEGIKPEYIEDVFDIGYNFSWNTLMVNVFAKGESASKLKEKYYKLKHKSSVFRRLQYIINCAIFIGFKCFHRVLKRKHTKRVRAAKVETLNQCFN